MHKPGVALITAAQVKKDIDEYCVKTYDGGHRNHLGASLIGHECSRYLWYIFRWCFREPTDGRKQRLFNRGHREEARFVEWLEGIGVKVWFEDRETDPLYYNNESDEYLLQTQIKSEEYGKFQPIEPADPLYAFHLARAKADGIEFPQYRISGVMGHFGGSLDGIAILPERYNIATPVLLEFKTNGTGKGFSELVNSGMPVAKPQHFAQTSTYGYKYGFDHVLYLNICKNDDDLHVEIAKLDHKLGEQMEAKAERIITSDRAPARLSDNPTFHKCGYCAAKDICHKGALPETNCRSCIHAKPVEGGAWFCDTYNAIIPREYIATGCGNHKPVTCNV